MAKENKKKSYWPHMIVGFLLVGITLGYWTVKSATSIPVQESNDYMLKYQQADMNINDILKKKEAFDKAYRIEIVDVTMGITPVANSKVTKKEQSVLLQKGTNSFHYKIITKDNTIVKDVNVTFLLTRPHTDKEDILRKEVPFKEGKYVVEEIPVQNAGRYILQLRATIGNMVGYATTPAYLKP